MSGKAEKALKVLKEYFKERDMLYKDVIFSDLWNLDIEDILNILEENIS